MNEEMLNNLLTLGFSYEDLYKRGLLVIKQDTQKDTQTAQDTQKDTQSAEYSKMWKAFDYFKTEIKNMIANANIQNATRAEDNDKDQMTVTAAIHGLYKGDK